MQIFLLLVLWCVRFRAFSEVQSQVRDRVQQPVPAPAQGQSESMIDYWRGSRAWSFQAFPGTSESLRKVLEMSRFLCEMNAANYCMALRHRLFLLMLVEGEHWRAHSKQIFKYKSGAWVQAKNRKNSNVLRHLVCECLNLSQKTIGHPLKTCLYVLNYVEPKTPD